MIYKFIFKKKCLSILAVSIQSFVYLSSLWSIFFLSCSKTYKSSRWKRSSDFVSENDYTTLTREDYFFSPTLTHNASMAFVLLQTGAIVSLFLSQAPQKRTEGQEPLLNLLINELGRSTKEKTKKNSPYLSRSRTQSTALVNTEEMEKYRCSGSERKTNSHFQWIPHIIFLQAVRLDSRKCPDQYFYQTTSWRIHLYSFATWSLELNYVINTAHLINRLSYCIYQRLLAHAATAIRIAFKTFASSSDCGV